MLKGLNSKGTAAGDELCLNKETTEGSMGTVTRAGVGIL